MGHETIAATMGATRTIATWGPALMARSPIGKAYEWDPTSRDAPKLNT